jgi:hypothetical protein
MEFVECLSIFLKALSDVYGACRVFYGISIQENMFRKTFPFLFLFRLVQVDN